MYTKAIEMTQLMELNKLWIWPGVTVLYATYGLYIANVFF